MPWGVLKVLNCLGVFRWWGWKGGSGVQNQGKGFFNKGTASVIVKVDSRVKKLVLGNRKNILVGIFTSWLQRAWFLL